MDSLPREHNPVTMIKILQNNKYNIGQHIYLNVPDGDVGIIVALVYYSDHVEYLTRFVDGRVSQLTESEISSEKIIV